MTRKKGSPLSPKPPRLIEEFKGALTAEIEKMKESPIKYLLGGVAVAMWGKKSLN